MVVVVDACRLPEHAGRCRAAGESANRGWVGGSVSWRFVNAAVRGTSHERGDVSCQDDCFVDVVREGNASVLVAIVSDGAGSAACAEEGSGLACETLFREVAAWLHGGAAIDALTRDVVESWMVSLREAIEDRAAQKQLTSREFVCTLAVAVVGTTSAAFIQLGDGAIVTGAAGAYEVVFWPDGGEYANMTYFITDADWQAHLQLVVCATFFDEIALMTDGLQRLALRFDSRAAHGPFFAPMFDALRESANGTASDLEASLVAFLSSDAVNERTDDDKSLVLASRRAGGTRGAV
ncbi:MAG TPA: PP2C family serine/threonine-protein phosphatase [Thermoanaerobaculia bacterium]